MNAVGVYVNAAKLVLQSTESTPAVVVGNQELPRVLVHLRQLLSCVVCCRLANDPFLPRNGRCPHNVCRLCVRGQKNLQPSCYHCKDSHDFKTYDENKQTRCLLLCYKSLCEHLRCSPVFAHLAGRKLPQFSALAPSILMPHMSIQDLIVEGASYEDVISSFTNDLPKPSIFTPKQQLQQPQMPALVTPFSSTCALTPANPMSYTQKNSTLTNQLAPKASTPPNAQTGPNNSCAVVGAVNPPPKLKMETASPPLSGAAVQQPVPVAQSSVKTSVSNTTHPHLIQLSQLKNSGNITYIGHNARGIVVPMVSSAGTTTAAPLTIASARLQTLNRQLAQARAFAVPTSSSPSSSLPNTTTLTTASEQRSPQSIPAYKVTLTSTAPSSASLVASLTSASSTSLSTCFTAATTATATSSQVRNPPPIKTVSNGSAMYSVLYTGIGNKITIKRKTDGEEEHPQKKNILTTAPSNPAIMRPFTKTTMTLTTKRRGCRCGNATPTPGKLTCCGQRCPCYVDSKSCIGCKCRGCRNPHRPDGNKVRPVIPELACYEIQMADDHSNINELPIATSSNNCTISHALSSSTATMASSAAAGGGNNTTLIPLRNIHITHSSIPPLTSASLPTITTTMTQASLQPSISSTESTATTSVSSASTGALMLDHMQRESVLIQNSEGKFQVVNLFTTASAQSSNQVPGLQRIHHTLPPTVVSASNNFILPSSIASTAIASAVATGCTQTPQIVLQSQLQHHHHQQHQQHQQQQQQHQQQHQQQQQQQQQHQQIQRIHNSIGISSSLPLHLQQQLKQNLIAVHSISNTSATANTSGSSPAATTAATLSLSPIIANKTQQQQQQHISQAADILTHVSDFQTLQNSNNYISISSNSSCSSSTTLSLSSLSSSSSSLSPAAVSTTAATKFVQQHLAAVMSAAGSESCQLME